MSNADNHVVPQAAVDVIEGLLEIARHAMPDGFWRSDSRINAARALLGAAFPDDEELTRRFAERLA